MEKIRVRLKVNGEDREVLAVVHHTLLEVLREEMGLPGTKHGCELGECGTCTVLIDGRPALSCVTLPVECEGRRIRTVEGLAEAGELHPLSQAFVALGPGQRAYAQPLRSPHPHARVRRVDVSKAAAPPGVLDTLVGSDLPIPFGTLPVSQDEHALALDKVRFVGDPVAAAAALDEEIAEAACRLIEVDYEVLPAFMSIHEALARPEARIHDYGPRGNVHQEVSFDFGDVE